MAKNDALLQEIVYRTPMMVRSFKSQDWTAFREALEGIKAVAGPDDPLDPVWDLLFRDGSGGILGEEDVGDSIWRAHRIFLEVKGEWESLVTENADPPLPEVDPDGQMSLPFPMYEPQE